jgi:hypothetical protein
MVGRAVLISGGYCPVLISGGYCPVLISGGYRRDVIRVRDVVCA